MRLRTALPILAAISAAALTEPVAALERERVVLTVERVVPNTAWSVYVLGNIAELGNSDLVNAIEMMEVSPGVWTVTVDIPVNTTYQYEFWQRRHSINFILNTSHGTMFSGPLNGQTRTDNSPPRRKWGWFQTSLEQPILYWRNRPTDPFQSMTLSDSGPGRSGTERRCYGMGIGPTGHDTEFFLTNSAGDQRDPASGVYQTKLDAFHLQDGHLFGYTPAATVSGLRRDYAPLSPPTLFSTILNEDRVYRVLLPRGYDEHTQRRYPVVYWHDGNLMWDAINPFGIDEFDIDGAISAEEMRNGRLAECIQVSMDPPGTTFCEVGYSRLRDYIPPGDSESLGCQLRPGHADNYVNFIISEMKPLIDAQYRTLPAREHTITAGASFGAIVSMYMAMDFSDVFSGVGCYSISGVTNIMARAGTDPVPDARIYIDSGNDNWTSAQTFRNALVQRASGGMALGSEFMLHFAPGAIHDFDDFGLRWPGAGAFLLPANRSAPELRMLTDLDADLDTDLTDLSLLLAAFGACSGDASFSPEADLDANGCVDLADLSMMLHYYGL